MADRAIRLRLYNVWQRQPGGFYLLVSTTSRFDAEQMSDRESGDFITEQDTWIETPEPESADRGSDD